MTHTKIATPATEQKYLQSNAILSVALGIYFTAGIWEWFLGDLAQGPVISGIVTFGALAVLIVALVYLSKASNGALSFNKKAFWLGRYEDEFLSHINHKGYQYAFNITAALLLVAIFLDPWVALFELTVSYTPQALAKFLIGALFLSYAIPVLCMLRGEDE